MPPSAKLIVGPSLPTSLQDLLTSTSTAYPPVPTIEELAAYSTAIEALRSAAEDRVVKCKDAAKIQRDVITRVEKRADEEKKGREKERLEKDRMKGEESVKKESEKVKKEEEKRQKERECNGTMSPTVRVKRELSGSPAPPTNGDYSALQQPSRKKKRKLEHAGSTSPELADRQHLPTHSGSRFASPASERPSVTPSIPNLKVKLKVTGDAPPKLARQPSSQHHMDFTPPPAHPTINFSLPSTSVRPLVPPRPPIPPPPRPGPKRQKDVNEDFSHSKQHNNPVQLGTFWTTVEHYLRDVSEDDLAMLGFRANDPEPFNIPALGRHYQEVWDEEDAHLPFGGQSNAIASSSALMQDVLPPRGKRMANRPPRFVPARDMTDDDLTDDLKGLGGVAERILGAMFALQQDGTDRRSSPSKLHAANGEETTSGLVTTSSTMVNGSSKGVNGTTGEEHQPVTSTDDTAPMPLVFEWPIQPHRIPNRTGEKDRASCAQVDMNELEEGLKREMKHLGLIHQDEDIDFTMRQDDEITTALRQCQRILRQQLAVNDARKNRMADAARDRLAYGDYKHTLSGLEAVITTAWQRRSSRKVRKGKSKEKEKEKEDVYVMGKKMPGSALPEQVKKAMEARRKWIDSVGIAFEGEDTAGRFKDLPTRSIYDGVEDEWRDER